MLFGEGSVPDFLLFNRKSVLNRKVHATLSRVEVNGLEKLLGSPPSGGQIDGCGVHLRPASVLDYRSLRVFVAFADCAAELLLVDTLICGPRPKMMLYVTGS